MHGEEGMRVVGTIRSIELHSLGAKFIGVTPRQIAKIQLNVEHATAEDGVEINIQNVDGISFLGAAELVPQFSAGDRVQIVTQHPGDMHIASIRLAPLS